MHMMTPTANTGVLRPGSRPLEVRLIVPQWTGSLGGDTPRWRDTLAVAQCAEAVGSDSLWVTDSLLLRLDEGEDLWRRNYAHVLTPSGGSTPGDQPDRLKEMAADLSSVPTGEGPMEFWEC
jgi:hypothetical protein